MQLMISLSVGTVKIIDSYNFLPMPLSALPKALGIEELCKGHFPHLLNTKEMPTEDMEWPDAYFFQPATMKPKSYADFMNWYKDQNGKVNSSFIIFSGPFETNTILKVFNLKSELIKYCKSDVDVLMKSCLKFRDMFIEETTVDPFENSLTIASACNRVYRKLFLKRNTIGVIPVNNYHPCDNQSAVAIKWLKWVSETEKIDIRHKLNGGEIKIGNYKVDGQSGNTVYEFHGCYWHGCPMCMKKRTLLTADRILTAKEAYEKTMYKAASLNAMGYDVIEIWECEFKKMLMRDRDMKAFIDAIDIVQPLNPRDGKLT